MTQIRLIVRWKIIKGVVLMPRIFQSLLLVGVLGLVLLGCSTSGTDPVAAPSGNPLQTATSGESAQTQLWAYYNVTINPVDGTVEWCLDRSVMFAANVVNFLNTNPASMSININGTETGTGWVDIDIDITLTHPLPGLPQYHGYDVMGVFMGDGSGTLEYNDDLAYPRFGTDQIMFANPDGGKGAPDGYTRWFNRPEFNGWMPLLSYTPGNLASAGFNGNATICPYRYFADGLGPEEDLWGWLDENSDQYGRFSSGASNTRNYYLRFPNTKGVTYGYAVVANWDGEDVHPANTHEVIASNADVTGGLYYIDDTENGGNLVAEISLFGWDTQPDSIYIESTVLSQVYELDASEMVPTGGTENYSTYHVDIEADGIEGTGGNEFWVIAEYENYDYSNDMGVPNQAGDDPLAAFFRYDLFVADDIPDCPVCDFHVEQTMPLSGWGEVDISCDTSGCYDPGGYPLTYEWDFDGNGIYGESPGDDYTGSADHPTYKYLESFTGDVSLRLDNGACSVECSDDVDIEVIPTTLYLYDGTVDDGGMERLPGGSPDGWAYVPSAQVWDENGDISGSLPDHCTILATPEIDIPESTEVASVHMKIKHWGRVERQWDGVIQGYTLDGGSTFTWHSPGTTVFTYYDGTDFITDNNAIVGLAINDCYGTALPWEGWDSPDLAWSSSDTGGWGSQSTPVESDWSCDSLLGTDGVQFVFLFVSDPYDQFEPGFCLRELEVYVKP